jgi:hypothetical protein
LVEAKATSESVWSSRVLYPQQEHEWLRNKVDALKKCAPSAKEKEDFTKRIEQLESIVRKMEERAQEKEAIAVAVQTAAQ